MKQPIKNLYDGLNVSTLPKSIKDAFYKLSNPRNSFYDLKPFMLKYKYDVDEIEFYILGRNIQVMKNFIEKKKIIDHNNSIITAEIHNEYLKEYGKGFYKGYFDFEEKIKPKSTLF